MSQYVVSTKPREPPQVYRCGNHWHFMPDPESTWFDPGPPNLWYKQRESPEKTFAIGPVYARDAGDAPYFVDDLLLSGFCSLYKEHQPREWCTGRYGKRERPLWRKEELSKTPWGSGRPPLYREGEEGKGKGREGEEGEEGEEVPGYDYGEGCYGEGKGRGNAGGESSKKGK